MNKWLVPLAVLGVGGVGVLVLSERGRVVLRGLFERIEDTPDRIADWNDRAQREIERIQTALNRVADSLEAVR